MEQREQRKRQRRAAEGEAAQHSVQLGGGAARRGCGAAARWVKKPFRRERPCRTAGEEAASEGEAVPPRHDGNQIARKCLDFTHSFMARRERVTVEQFIP